MACSGTTSPTSPRAHAVLPSGRPRGKHAQSCVCGRIPGLGRGTRGTSNSLRLAFVAGGGVRGSHPESRTSTGCSLPSLLLRPLVQAPLPSFFFLCCEGRTLSKRSEPKAGPYQPNQGFAKCNEASAENNNNFMFWPLLQKGSC